MQTSDIIKPVFRQILQDIPGSEGPVFTPDGSFYVVAPEIENKQGKPAGQVIRVDLNSGKKEVHCSPSIGGFGGIPAGCQSDKDGHLWVADMRLGLLHITPTGHCKQICKRDFTFQPMQGCNDCAFDSAGNLWITAPAGSIAPAAYTRSMEKPFGSLYCYTIEGKMIKVDTGYKFPNGIAVQHSATGKPQWLIVAETGTKQLWSFPFVKDDESKWKVDISKKTSFGHCPGHHIGGPDGLDFDCENNLLVANWGSGYIEVFGKFGGRPHTRIQLPFKKVSNLHFRPGSCQVLVTEHDTHGLWSFEWVREGAKQFCDI